MTKAETRPTSSPEKGSEHAELSQLLGDIANVLDEMADAEADAAYRVPCAPCSHLSEGLADLLYRLRRRFLVDAGYRLREELLNAETSFADDVIRIHSERDILRTALDDILELAVWSGQPDTSWVEIEARFRCFARRVTEYVASTHGRCPGPVITRALTP